MEEKEIVLSSEGYQRIQDELDYLRNIKRKEVALRLKEARALGDLSENAEYDDARNEQGFVEGRIAQLEKTLRSARVGELKGNGETIQLGTRVRLKDLEYGDEETYIIVSSVEANPAERKISDESPVGRAILGQRPGGVVTVYAPGGQIQYEILEILA